MSWSLGRAWGLDTSSMLAGSQPETTGLTGLFPTTEAARRHWLAQWHMMSTPAPPEELEPEPPTFSPVGIL